MNVAYIDKRELLLRVVVWEYISPVLIEKGLLLSVIFLRRLFFCTFFKIRMPVIPQIC